MWPKVLSFWFSLLYFPRVWAPSGFGSWSNFWIVTRRARRPISPDLFDLIMWLLAFDNSVVFLTCLTHPAWTYWLHVVFQCLLSHWRSFFTCSVGKQNCLTKKCNCFLKTCQILLPTWVNWAVVSSFNRLQAHTQTHTHNHVAAKWQQTHIYILFKERM